MCEELLELSEVFEELENKEKRISKVIKDLSKDFCELETVSVKELLTRLYQYNTR